jgi:hypothetical protein
MLFLTLIASTLARYPPDYVVGRTCQRQGEVEVCLINKGVINPRIEVKYYDNGYLWDKLSPISVWVASNDNNGQRFGKMAAIESNGQIVGATYTLNKLNNVFRCYQATTNDPPTYAPGGIARCPFRPPRFALIDGPANNGAYTWYFENAPENEKSFVESLGFGRWDLQLAFVNDRGDWDSLHGANYKFQLIKRLQTLFPRH